MSDKPSSAEERMAAFATAWSDPSSSTYENATESFLQAVDNTVTRESAGRMGRRYLDHQFVKNRILAIQESARNLAALTVPQFVERALDREAQLFEAALRGEKGAANAAVKYMELAGKGLGAFVTQTRDLTLPAPQESDESLLNRLGEKVARMKQLSKPLPETTDAEVLHVEDAQADDVDFATVSEPSDGADVAGDVGIRVQEVEPAAGSE